MTEKTIQDQLFHLLHGKEHNLIIPNVHVNGWEADVVSVTKAGLVNEYEIKTSVADYKNEFGKSRTKIYKHKVFSGKRTRNNNYTPNYFWFVLGFDHKKVRVPEYAGLIMIKKDRYGKVLMEIKKAPRLHSDKITKRNLDYISRGLCYRYWKLRTRKKRRKL